MGGRAGLIRNLPLISLLFLFHARQQRVSSLAAGHHRDEKERDGDQCETHVGIKLTTLAPLS